MSELTVNPTLVLFADQKLRSPWITMGGRIHDAWCVDQVMATDRVIEAIAGRGPLNPTDIFGMFGWKGV